MTFGFARQFIEAGMDLRDDCHHLVRFRRHGTTMSHNPIIRRVAIAATLLAAILSQSAPAQPSLTLDKVVVLMRHGVRAPLDGEVPDATRTARPWPRWPVAESQLTDRGARAMTLLGAFDRRRWAALGLFSQTGCPTIRIRANTAVRTIASGEAFARGFAPGCTIAVAHRDESEVDPIFEPLRAGATDFDATKAVADIQRYTDGIDALTRRHAGAIRLLDRVLGCGAAVACADWGRSRVTPSRDGRGVGLAGPIRATSGIAQVLLLQQAEGFPRAQVGWGRADAATLRRLGALHAALFDVFTRSPYIAAHQSAVLGRHMLAALADRDGPSLDLLVGHDTNVTALAATLGVDLVAPGYAPNDVAPGGAIVIERLRDRASGTRYVRLFYQAQPLPALRALSPQIALTPLTMRGCTRLCRQATFDRILRARLATTRAVIPQ